MRMPIDHLFKRRTQAAMRRHAGADFMDEELIPADCFIDDESGYMFSGINAGVMVMRPCKEDYEAMLKDIKSQKHKRTYRKSCMPEQDYLTRFYNGKWHHLDVRYNYQPHQVAFTARDGLQKCTRLTLDFFSEVSIVHFSAAVKPRDHLVNPEYVHMTRSEFTAALNSLYEQRMIKEDDPFGDEQISIKSQLRSVTYCFCGEWFQHWDSVLMKIPELSFLVNSACLDSGIMFD